jgi:hypothetical protein
MKHIIQLLFFFITFSSVQASDFTLEHLMALLASQTELKAQFKEQKFDSFLEIPLTSRGQVTFLAPHYLEKKNAGPSAQSFTLNGDKVTVSIKNKETKTFSIEQQPEIRAFTESFRSTLSGDLETLKKFYDVKLSGQIDQWDLQLKPINKNISRAIREIQFTGQNNRIAQVITRYRNGDYSVMEFFPDKSLDTGNE